MDMIISSLLNTLSKGVTLYLDPGSGSFLLQLLIASGLGALFVLRSSWSKIKTFFGKGPADQDEDDEGLDE
jgi:hypothetical protein